MFCTLKTKCVFVILLLIASPSLLYSQLVEIKEDESQWNFLLNDIGNDSIVCLGEESHWVETYLELKKSIIETLHKEKEFDVIIFESGFVNSFVSYKEQLTGKIKLKETLYEIWQTVSTQKLIDYFDLSQNTEKPIIQLGCDIKGPISFKFSKYLQTLFNELEAEEYGEKLSNLDSGFVRLRYEWEPEIGKANRGVFLSADEFSANYEGYLMAYDSINTNREKIIQKKLLTEVEFEFLKRCIENRIHLLKLMQLPTYQQKHKYRDSIMAENVNWLIEEFLPNHKYIIWGADIHISKDAKWEDMGKEWGENESLIELLLKMQKREIFLVGIKPRSSIDRKIRRKLNIKSKKYYIDLRRVGISQNLKLKFRGEHEALIICTKIKKINRFKIE